MVYRYIPAQFEHCFVLNIGSCLPMFLKSHYHKNYIDTTCEISGSHGG
jgi:hypothetical protein